MAHPALIDALRKSAEQKAAAIWRDARAAAEQCKADAAAAAEAQRAQTRQEIAAHERELADAGEGEGKARKIRMAVTTALAERLYRLAHEVLPRFRNEEYEALFAALAGELPSRSWQRVSVNPADESLARARFSQAQIVCDEAIVGGMEVQAENGRIRISNTLETRLATAWPDILPGLVHAILQEFSDHRLPT